MGDIYTKNEITHSLSFHLCYQFIFRNEMQLKFKETKTDAKDRTSAQEEIILLIFYLNSILSVFFFEFEKYL